ncbi:hypothetical protein [Streptomyces zaomyceticus]|uniref:hypothetical protein n=1 Tax=Streptomyces zaomyceticus TaxID=68286 RepID=UPI001673AFD0|nr:hypothetical protein [Streptomyces zaomyceticus]GHG00446.1 hypothetical protein GCM10018791_09690 [Streptomyces zaomyceticus]
MSRSLAGTAVGMALGFAAWFGGFAAFLLVAALGALGGVVGHLWDERTDPRDLVARWTRERR